MNKIKYIFLALIFVSCIPEDTPVEPLERGNVEIEKIAMGNYYENQIYFSFDQDTTVAINEVTIWDLAFTTQEEDFHILINFATSAKLFNLGQIDFDSVTEDNIDAIQDEDWKYDNQFGKTDSTAIGKWWNSDADNIISKEDVYIINRGISPKAKKLGNAKFQIISFENNLYKIRFANLKDNIIHEAFVPKDNNFNYVYLSLSNSGELKYLEPVKTSWDILFSKYMDLLYTTEGDAMWYSVTSVLINGNGVEVATMKTTDFEGIDISVIDSLQFNNNKNVIGHEWKWYDLEGGSYTVLNNQVFIIKNIKGFYYKMRFIDFYDDNGDKGYPKFEYKLL